MFGIASRGRLIGRVRPFVKNVILTHAAGLFDFFAMSAVCFFSRGLKPASFKLSLLVTLETIFLRRLAERDVTRYIFATCQRTSLENQFLFFFRPLLFELIKTVQRRFMEQHFWNINYARSHSKVKPKKGLSTLREDRVTSN